MFRHIETYSHQNRIGVIVELGVDESVTLVEPTFLELAKDVALHIAAGETNGEASGKELLELLSEPYVKHRSVSILDHLKHCEQQLNDSIRLIRYVRYAID